MEGKDNRIKYLLMNQIKMRASQEIQEYNRRIQALARENKLQSGNVNIRPITNFYTTH